MNLGSQQALATDPGATNPQTRPDFDHDADAPGANDDGSGTVLSMELARVFAESGIAFDATLVFMTVAAKSRACSDRERTPEVDEGSECAGPGTLQQRHRRQQHRRRRNRGRSDRAAVLGRAGGLDRRDRSRSSRNASRPVTCRRIASA